MEWITVNETSELVNRQPVTLRYLINKHLASDDQRECFKYQQSTQTGRKIWLIEKSSLLKYYNTNTEINSGKRSQPHNVNTPDQRLISVLERDIQDKINTIQSHEKIIAALNERLKEAQFMLASEQKARRLIEEKNTEKKGLISGLLSKYGL